MVDESSGKPAIRQQRWKWERVNERSHCTYSSPISCSFLQTCINIECIEKPLYSFLFDIYPGFTNNLPWFYPNTTLMEDRCTVWSNPDIRCLGCSGWNRSLGNTTRCPAPVRGFCACLLCICKGNTDSVFFPRLSSVTVLCVHCPAQQNMQMRINPLFQQPWKNYFVNWYIDTQELLTVPSY